jgi:ubiquinone/menaquinone biosynthesis C-methylase UbiE
MFIFNYSNIIDPLLRDIRIFVPDFAGMKKGDKVLDVCCGTGDQVFYYAEKGIIVSGVDSDPNMIKLAKKDKRRKRFIDVFFQIADAKNLPFENNCFDYASISFGLHEKGREDRDKIISEMKRVVKEDGSLVFIDFQVPLPGNIYSYFVQAIEYLAGKSHFKHFQDYIKQGGLDEILKNNQLVEEKKVLFKSQNVAIIKTSALDKLKKV